MSHQEDDIDEPETEGESEGYNINVYRDSDTEDWYIQVTHIPDGGFVYDGWWRDSADKTVAEAIHEAMKGAQITP